MVKNPIHDVRFRPPSGVETMVQVVDLERLRERELDHSLYESQRRDFHVLHVVTSGKGRHNFEFGSLRLKEGDLLHVRPGQVDCFAKGSKHGALLVLFVPEAISRQSAVRLRITNPLRPGREEFARIEELVRLIQRYQGVAALQEANLLLLQALLCAVDALHAEAGSLSSSSVKTELCERFDQLLEERVGKRRSVSWYADRLEVSSKTLGRASSDVFGCSPKRHLDSRVSLQAKRLLVHTPETVEEIADRLGFSEPTNFVKFFRRMEGCTPQSFRGRFRS